MYLDCLDILFLKNSFTKKKKKLYYESTCRYVVFKETYPVGYYMLQANFLNSLIGNFVNKAKINPYIYKFMYIKIQYLCNQIYFWIYCL